MAGATVLEVQQRCEASRVPEAAVYCSAARSAAAIRGMKMLGEGSARVRP
jgi:hypothetical protein